MTAQVKLTKITEALVKDILRVYDINSARVVIREDIDDEQLVDVLFREQGLRPSLTVMNKIDLVNAGFTNELTSKLPYNFVPISAEADVNLKRAQGRDLQEARLRQDLHAAAHRGDRLRGADDSQERAPPSSKSATRCTGT